jgi:hypothetical protein
MNKWFRQTGLSLLTIPGNPLQKHC